MEFAATMLEDRTWMKDFLARSQQSIAKQRLRVEELLDNAGIDYYRRGCVFDVL